MDTNKIFYPEFDGLNGGPDFCDAYITRAWYGDREMTEAELNELNKDSALVSELVNEYIY